MKKFRKLFKELNCYFPKKTDAGDEESKDEGRQEATIDDLANACAHGDIEEVKRILGSGEVDVNAEDRGGVAPLLYVMLYNRIDILRLLLARDDLDLGVRGRYTGCTALHQAYLLHYLVQLSSYPIIEIFCHDYRCTPGIVNTEDYQGETVLYKAVKAGYLDIVKELDKVEGTDFHTKDSQGDTLVEVARRCGHDEVVEYLVERNKKVDSLKVIAAKTVAKYMKAESDVEHLEIPHFLHRLVAGFLGDKNDNDKFIIESDNNEFDDNYGNGFDLGE